MNRTHQTINLNHMIIMFLMSIDDGCAYMEDAYRIVEKLYIFICAIT